MGQTTGRLFPAQAHTPVPCPPCSVGPGSAGFAHWLSHAVCVPYGTDDMDACVMATEGSGSGQSSPVLWTRLSTSSRPDPCYGKDSRRWSHLGDSEEVASSVGPSPAFAGPDRSWGGDSLRVDTHPQRSSLGCCERSRLWWAGLAFLVGEFPEVDLLACPTSLVITSRAGFMCVRGQVHGAPQSWLRGGAIPRGPTLSRPMLGSCSARVFKFFIFSQ